MTGCLTIILGAMFSHKSSTLIKILNRGSDTGHRGIYINHDIDNRTIYGGKCYTTHNKLLDQGVSSFDQIKADSITNVGLQLLAQYQEVNIYNDNLSYFSNTFTVIYENFVFGQILENSHLKILNPQNQNNKKLNIYIDQKDDQIRTSKNTAESDYFTKKLENLIDLTYLLLSKYDKIGIDEGQFFADIHLIKDLVLKYHKDIIVVALKADANLQKFGNVIDLIPLASHIKIKKAKCMKCMTIYIHDKPIEIKAPHTYKLGLKENHEQIIDIGGDDKYIACCLACHNELRELFENNYERYLEIRQSIFENLEKIKRI